MKDAESFPTLGLNRNDPAAGPTDVEVFAALTTAAAAAETQTRIAADRHERAAVDLLRRVCLDERS